MSEELFTLETTGSQRNEVNLVAVGGCGLSILDELMLSPSPEFRSVALDTDCKRLAETESDVSLLLGESLTEGYGTGGDELVGARCLAGKNVEVREHLNNGRVNILIGGLGGGTATPLLPELAKISRSLGMLTIVVCTRPFRYEGSQKSIAAKRRMHSLFRSADSVFVISNEQIVEGAGKLSASEAVKRSDTAVLETIIGILEFVSPMKRMLLDFGDIKSQLTRGGLCGFATGISAMRNNAIEALKMAIDAFARRKSDITKAPRALIQFAIDNDVLMDGVKNAFGVAQRVFSKDAQLAMGVVFNNSKQGKTRVSVIASGLPLFNEVVDGSIASRAYEGYELSQRPQRKVAIHSGEGRSGVNAALKRNDEKNLRILNPRVLSEDELKIPAYLRRRGLRSE